MNISKMKHLKNDSCSCTVTLSIHHILEWPLHGLICWCGCWNLSSRKMATPHATEGQARYTWWHYQMETFFALLALCAGNSPVICEFPSQRPVTRSFDVLFDLRLNKRLSRQSWGWWFETPSRSSWRHCNEYLNEISYIYAELIAG